ncbi:MAG: TSUP family transporter [Gammaproteobacteria bacterium]|nr:TSUP family transporter [Gammaproteobacteria bacterium]
MLPEFSNELLMLFVAVGFAAGLVDAIAGGGGLLALPVLLSAGLPPLAALATNKLTGSFGTLSASLHFLGSGHARWKRIGPAVGTAFVGSVFGTWAVQHLEADFLGWLVPLLLIAFAAYFAFAHPAGDAPPRRRVGEGPFRYFLSPLIGAYDGFFGPGAGTFFVAARHGLHGDDLTQATAHTKFLNLASNLAALSFFALAGHVVWMAGLAMGVGQFTGARVGAYAVVRHGARLVRPLLVVVSLALSLRLLFSEMG